MITIFHRKEQIQVPDSDFKSKIEELESDLDTLNRQLLQKNWRSLETIKCGQYDQSKTALDNFGTGSI